MFVLAEPQVEIVRTRAGSPLLELVQHHGACQQAALERWPCRLVACALPQHPLQVVAHLHQLLTGCWQAAIHFSCIRLMMHASRAWAVHECANACAADPPTHQLPLQGLRQQHAVPRRQMQSSAQDLLWLHPRRLPRQQMLLHLLEPLAPLLAEMAAAHRDVAGVLTTVELWQGKGTCAA